MGLTALLKDKVALVTGSSRGIGKEIACLFAEHQAQVILHGLKEEHCRATAAEIERKTGQAPVILAADLSESKNIDTMFREIFSQFKTLDILVNNAGVLEDRLIGMINSENMEKIFKVNTYGTLLCLQSASRLMRKSSCPSIINLSSIIGVEGAEGQSVYAASKAAVLGLTKSAAKELGPQGIRVNTIAPGLIQTDMIEHLSDNVVSTHVEHTSLRRLGTPEDVANAALFLASDMSSFVTGQTLGVDGGMRV